MIGLVFVLVPLLTRRYRLLLYLVVANIGAAALMWATLRLIDRDAADAVIDALHAHERLTTATATDEIGFARIAASFVVLAPFVSSRWRRAGAVTLGVLVLFRFLVADHLPGDVFVAIPLGATVGTAVLAAFGRPDRRPTPNAVRLALVDAGLAVTELHPATPAPGPGTTAYHATADGREELFVKVVGEEDRAADLLYRAYRFARLKDVGDDRPFSSLRRAVEHEALVSLVARDVGVRTPRMRGVARVGLDSMIVAYDAVDGPSIDLVAPDEVGDDVMSDLFRQLGLLRAHRVAHRDLRRANILLAGGEPYVVDFGFAELAADDGQLDADLAQLMAALTVIVGPQRPVRQAVGVLGRDAVARALPRLQLQALSGPTQAAMKEHKGLLAELQREVQEQAGVEEVHFVELERFDRRMILLVLIVVGATYFLLPQFADLPGILRQVRDANWAWAPLILLMSLLTYVGASAALLGAVPSRLPAGPIVVGQVASEFASKLAPAGVGGMALNVRLLQKQGVDRAVAVSGVGLDTVAGVVGHVSLIGVFIVWAGRDAFGGLHVPDVHWFWLGALVAAVLVAIGFAVPYSRRVFTQRLLPVVRRAFDGVSEVVRRPAKLALLIGGSIFTTVSYLLALYFCVVAFGGGVSLATVGAIYLVGSAVANAAPTPGGLGAMEAALIGGLVAAGLDNAVAVPAVFLFRLATFWLPILPGWLSFHWLQRHDYV
jgi:undecaprenyl-diphosphatase